VTLSAPVEETTSKEFDLQAVSVLEGSRPMVAALRRESAYPMWSKWKRKGTGVKIEGGSDSPRTIAQVASGRCPNAEVGVSPAVDEDKVARQYLVELVEGRHGEYDATALALWLRESILFPVSRHRVDMKPYRTSKTQRPATPREICPSSSI
jgi:hypothetical protein